MAYISNRFELKTNNLNIFFNDLSIKMVSRKTYRKYKNTPTKLRKMFTLQQLSDIISEHDTSNSDECPDSTQVSEYNNSFILYARNLTLFICQKRFFLYFKPTLAEDYDDFEINASKHILQSLPCIIKNQKVGFELDNKL